uniref:DEAD/DEAH box helicase n=1 Tax=Trebonia sp. TaxID=2767075 RepID=UPI00261DB559
GQLPAVEALAAGRDALAVLPTGGGKSAIYELAGMLRDGPTVVVSPLIALQDDQLAHLRSAGLRAIVLNSQQSAGARAASLLASCDSGTFLFLSPEQLANEETRQTLRRARPGLLTVDEAHLISQWGHDFRPDYMLLGAQADAIGAPVRLALTATAAPPVRQEIVRRLGLRDPVVVIGDFDRPNIALAVRSPTCRERIRTLSKTRKRRSDGPGMLGTGAAVRSEGVPYGHAMATPRESAAVTSRRLPRLLRGGRARPLRRLPRRRLRGRPRRTAGR